MVCENIHIICGNCGQDLKQKGMATWEYKPLDIDEETGEIFHPADVWICCENCSTLHFLNNYIEEYKEDTENNDTNY